MEGGRGMNLKALCAAGVIISMISPVGHTAFANSDAVSSHENKVFSTTSQAISTTGTSIFVDKTPSVSKKPDKEKPVFSAKAKSRLEKPVEYETGQLVTLPDGNNFYREGYRFVGWNTDPKAESGFFEIVMEKDTVLYAVWIKEKSNSTTESSLQYKETVFEESNSQYSHTGSATTESALSSIAY